MEGVVELAEEIFHMPVRLGVPQHVTGLVDVVKNPIHATGVGLLIFGQQSRLTPRTESVEVASQEGLLERMKRWFQDNF